METCIGPKMASHEFQLQMKHTHGVRVDQDVARTCGSWYCCGANPLATRFCELARMKDKMLADLLMSTADPRLRNSLSRAAEEAAALAWTTAYPLLVFPVLLDEKTAEARRYNEHQCWVQDCTRTYYMDALCSSA